MINQIETSKGVLKFKTLNVPGALKIYGRIRKRTEKSETSLVDLSEEEWLSFVLEDMGFLFDTSGMGCTYEELLEDDDAAAFLIEKAGDIMAKIGNLIKKKASSGTGSAPTAKE